MDHDGAALLAELRAAVAGQDWEDAATIASGLGPFDDPGVEAERLDLLADAAWWLGRLGQCTSAREGAYRLYDDLGLGRKAGSCAVSLYEHHGFEGRPAVAGAWLRRGRRALEGDETCAEYGALMLREAEVDHGNGALDLALARADRVVALAESIRSFDLQAEAHQAAGRVLIDRGDAEEGLRRLDEAMLFAVEGRTGPYSTGKVYCSMISACEEVGDYARAAEWSEVTQLWADNHPFSIFPGICRVHRASILKQRGQLLEAESEASKACDELRHSRPVAAAVAWIEVGDICRRLGELDRAEQAFLRAQEIQGSPCSALALLRLAQGMTDAAKAIIGGCMDRITGPVARARLLPHFVQVAVAAGDLDAARAAVDEYSVLVDDLGTQSARASFEVARGRVLLASSDAEGARGVLRDAMERWQVLGVPYEVASTGALLGHALRECGDEVGAEDAFRSSSALFGQIGARMDIDAVMGGPSAGPRLAGLTDREIEVLRLVAAGMTNQQIAASLVLSIKTVSRHLSNIFTKIGVSSRTAATAFAYESGIVERGPSLDPMSRDGAR